MKIPTKAVELIDFAKNEIDNCLVSRETRRAEAQFWRNLYFTGQVEDGVPARHNKCYAHIDTMASFLFSPSDTRFVVGFDDDDLPEWSEKASKASRHINREFSRRACDLAFAQAVEIALIEGTAFVKLVWSHNGYEPYLVRQQFMGVSREDQNNLDRQDSFVHSYYLTRAQFGRLLVNHPDKADILKNAASIEKPAQEELIGDSYFNEIVMGGMQPVSAQLQPGVRGQVGVFRAARTPVLAPEVAQSLIRVDDLWVFDDVREDWTTIRYCEPGVLIEGKYKHRSLSDAPKQHPFIKVCANEVDGYFWGRSELANVAELQGEYNGQRSDIRRIMRLQANPPRSFIGGANITAEKLAALQAPGGTLTENDPTGGQIQSLAPDMPANSFQLLEIISDNFAEAGGINGILSGQGEEGVRSGGHANMLVRMAGARVRDRALSIEKQAAGFGDLCLDMSAAKDARMFTTPNGQKFLLSQLPEDSAVTVDSHSSSPIFSGDHTNLAFALHKAGAMDAEDLLEQTQPPHVEKLVIKARKRAEEQAKLIKEHPELLQKGAHGGHGHGG